MKKNIIFAGIMAAVVFILVSGILTVGSRTTPTGQQQQQAFSLQQAYAFSPKGGSNATGTPSHGNNVPQIANPGCTPSTQDKNFNIDVTGKGTNSILGAYQAHLQITGRATIADNCKLGATMTLVPGSPLHGQLTISNANGIAASASFSNIPITKSDSSGKSVITVNSFTITDSDGDTAKLAANLPLSQLLSIHTNSYPLTGTMTIDYTNGQFTENPSVTGTITFS